MTFTKKRFPNWRTASLEYALFTGVLLATANYAMDLVLNRIGISRQETLLDDLAIGILGGVAVFYFLSASHARENFEDAKRRMVLVAELNLQVRKTFLSLAASALSDDRLARLHGLDEATERIDVILSGSNTLPESSTELSLAKHLGASD